MKSSRIRLAVLTAMVALCSLPLIVIGESHRDLAIERPAEAAVPPAPHLVSAPGIVEPATEERDIAASVTGRLMAPMLDEGAPVAAGQIIAEVENDDLKAQLDSAQAHVAVRQNELARLLAGAREEERKEAAAALEEADAALHLAQRNMGRRQSLVQDGIASVESVDAARADVDSAAARRELMAARFALISAPPRPEDVAIAEANVAASQAEVADLQARIEKTRLRSPIDGVILKRYKMPGETVSDLPPTLVVKVGDLSHLRVRAEIDEADVGRVSVGQTVTITADAFGTRRFTGKVVKLGTRLGPKYIKTDEPRERFDTKTLEAIVALDGHPPFPEGLRVDLLFEDAPQGLASR